MVGLSPVPNKQLQNVGTAEYFIQFPCAFYAYQFFIYLNTPSTSQSTLTSNK